MGEAAAGAPAAEAVVEAAPEAVVEAAVEATAEPVVEAAAEVVAEAAAEVVAEAAAEVVAEAAAPVESAEELVDAAPVIAEAAGEELLAEAPAEPEPIEAAEALMDPIQQLFLQSIREYSTKSQASGGLVDAGPEYQKALAQEIVKLERLYGTGDLTAFPEFTFPEPKFDDVSK